MVDHVSSTKRSDMMRLVRQTGSKPELTVRRMIWSLGYRYRLNVKNLPGSPDIVFRRMRKVIFVHGCFWHGHAGCPKSRLPKSNVEYWRDKITANMRRDAEVIERLQKEGWSVQIVWQCELRDPSSLLTKLRSFLES